MTTTAPFTEKELLSLLKQKNTLAFNYLYDKYGPLIYGIIVSEVKNTKLASDILRNTFINVINECRNIDCIKNSLFSWMLKLTRITAKEDFDTNLVFRALTNRVANDTVKDIPLNQQQLYSAPVF